MNKLYYVAAAALAGLAMTSCANNDLLEETGAKKGEARISVVLDYTDLDKATRTVFEKDGRNLSCTWSEGDEILVINAETGAKLGKLAISEGVGEKNAKFDGTLTGVEEGVHNYTYIFLGNEQKPADVQAADALEFDFSKQSGKFEDLDNKDFMCSTAETTVAEGQAFVENMKLHRRIAFAHFNMTFPEGVTYNGEDIEISGSHLYNKINLGFANAETKTFDIEKTAGTITVNTTDMYLVIVPDLENKTDLKFTCTIGKQDYICTLGERQWVESEYVNLNENDGVLVKGEANLAYNYTINYHWSNPGETDMISGSVMNISILNAAAEIDYKIGYDGENLIGAPEEFEDYEFKGWAAKEGDTTDLTGTTTHMDKDDNVRHYYAIWEHKNYTFTVILDYNGGYYIEKVNGVEKHNTTATITEYDKATTHKYEFANADEAVRPNYTFKGWKATDAEGKSYLIDANGNYTPSYVTVKKNETLTFKAIWEKNLSSGSTEDGKGSDY